MRILATTWYHESLAADLFPAGKRGPRRALQLWRAARDYDVLVTTEGQEGVRGLLVLLALFAWRKPARLVLLEFLPGSRVSGRGRLVVAGYGLLLRRAVSVVQVLSSWEREYYRSLYRLSPEQISFVAWPLVSESLKPANPVPHVQRSRVLASGRNACDWPTLLAAAARSDWPLTVVCSRADESEVRRLAAAGTDIRCEIPSDEYERLVADAAVYVLCLRENMLSSGHIRLMAAVSNYTPVVATNVIGLLVDRQLAVPQVREASAAEAVGKGSSYRWADYLSAVRGLVESVRR
jgi:hypothetical protein